MAAILKWDVMSELERQFPKKTLREQSYKHTLAMDWIAPS